MRNTLLLVLLLTGSWSWAQEWQPAKHETQAATAIQQWNVPGVVVAVVHGRESHTFGVGRVNIDSPVPPNSETLVPLASCTKAVSTTLLASLVAEKKLAWDDPVRKHLPEFRLSDAQIEARITIRDLVTHRSGIRGHDFLWYHAPWNSEEILRRVGKLPVDRPFRDSFEYSTLMFQVAGKVAEKAGGKPWAKLVRERITQPLGMTSVYFQTRDPHFEMAARLTGYRRDRAGKLIALATYETKEPNPAGSIHLTAKDFVPWLRFQLNNGQFEGNELIPAEQLLETRRPQNPMTLDARTKRLNPDTTKMDYAMGWLAFDYRGHEVVAHGGMIDGFRVQVTLFPKQQIGIAMVNNLHDTKMNQALTNTIADSLLGLPAKDWNAILREAVRQNDAEREAEEQAVRNARRKDVPPSVPLSDFVGKYHEPAYGEAEIVLEKGKLLWKWSSFAVPLDHWEGDTFRFAEGVHEDKLLPFRVGKTGPDAFRFEGQLFTRK